MYQIADAVTRDPYFMETTFKPSQFGLTKEALSILEDNVDSLSKHTPALVDAVRLKGNELHVKIGFQDVIRPTTITNAWGDEVEIFLWPRSNISLEHKYTPSCPMLIAGEMTSAPSFPLLDQQFEGEGPWTIEMQSNTFKP
jgi:hypothetical protein